MSKFGLSLKKFWKSDRGATAVLWGILALPIAAIAGGAVDYGKALRVKSELAVTLDAAVLAAAQAHALDDETDVQKLVRDFIKKNYTEAGKTLLSSELIVNSPTISDDGELTVVLDTKVPNHFLGLVGFEEFDYSLSSSAKVGGNSLEVSLVLDNTQSMSGSKLQALKEASTDLVEALMSDTNGDKVKLSLVPYADYVNIGTEHRFEPGLDIPDDYSVTTTDPGGEHCWWEYPNSTRQCTRVTEPSTCYRDGVPYSCTKTVRWDCVGDRGEGVRHCEDRPSSEATKDYGWPGCMGSRPNDLNVRDEDYGVQGVPGIMSTSSHWCRQISPVTRLTSDKSTITSALDQMKAARWTYIPGGLAWGWRTISDQAPFADGVSYGDDTVKKVVVLMTDGKNTLSMRRRNDASTQNHAGEVWAHSARTTPAPTTDMHTAQLCENIKAKGIVIHTIAFEVEEGSSIEGLMRGCAGNGGQYFDADDSQELTAAFKKIALALLNLRLSR